MKEHEGTSKPKKAYKQNCDSTFATKLNNNFHNITSLHKYSFSVFSFYTLAVLM